MLIIDWLPCCWSNWHNLVIKQFIRPMETSMFDAENGCCCFALNMSMFNVASWMSCVNVWCCSLCTCARWLLSRAFEHKISLIDLIVFVSLVNNYYMSMVMFVVDCCVLQPARRHLCRRHRCWHCYGSSSSLSRDATWSALVHDWKPCALAHNGLRQKKAMCAVVYFWRFSLCPSMFDVAWLVGASMFDA